MITLDLIREAAIELAIDDYRAGATVAALSRSTGLPRSTLRDRILAAGAHQPGRPAHATGYTHCRRAHPLDVHGRARTDHRGGRYCTECLRISQRRGFPGWAAYDLKHGPYAFPDGAVVLGRR